MSEKGDDYIDADLAEAVAMDSFTSAKRIKAMSYLKNEADGNKVLLMLSMGRRKPFKFLRLIARDRLLVACSTDKGFRSKQLAKIFEGKYGKPQGLWEKATEKVKSFVDREG